MYADIFLRGLCYVYIEKNFPYNYSNLLPIKEVCYPSWPLSHSNRVAGPAALAQWLSSWSSHSATLPERLDQPLSQSSQTHSATLPKQPLSHLIRVASPATLTKQLSNQGNNFRHYAFNLLLLYIYIKYFFYLIFIFLKF